MCKAVCSHRKEVARQQCEATVRGPVRARVRQPPCELALREMNSHFYGVPHCVIATLARRRICSHFPRRSSLSPLIGRSWVLTDFDQLKICNIVGLTYYKHRCVVVVNVGELDCVSRARQQCDRDKRPPHPVDDRTTCHRPCQGEPWSPRVVWVPPCGVLAHRARIQLPSANLSRSPHV